MKTTYKTLAILAKVQEEYDSMTKAQAKDVLISLCEEAEKLVGVIDYLLKQIELYKHHRAISDAVLNETQSKLLLYEDDEQIEAFRAMYRNTDSEEVQASIKALDSTLFHGHPNLKA